jgi:hypothetical protein
MSSDLTSLIAHDEDIMTSHSGTYLPSGLTSVDQYHCDHNLGTIHIGLSWIWWRRTRNECKNEDVPIPLNNLSANIPYYFTPSAISLHGGEQNASMGPNNCGSVSEFLYSAVPASILAQIWIKKIRNHGIAL